MTRNTKIILGIVGGLLALCICVAVVAVVGLGLFGRTIANNTSTDPEKAATIGHSVVDYQLPAGWHESVGTQILGITMVAINMNDSNGYAMLMQFPANMAGNQAAMENQMRQAMQQRNPGAPASMQVVSQRQATIRGQQVTFDVSEGTNSQGQTYRSLSGVFQGKTGLVLLTLAQPASSWNETDINAFLNSLR